LKLNSYDTLGRRIRKSDFIADSNNYYYYNDNWQVLCEYDGAGALVNNYMWGSYIDELVYKWGTSPASRRYFIHDHLFSPACTTNNTGTVQERYEYDTYGRPTVMDASYQSTTSSNNYYFTGKRGDFLDGGDLFLMHWPYRDYSVETGRWLQNDKLGVIPADNAAINPFSPTKQYTDGMNLYEYVESNPVTKEDSFGLLCFGPYCREKGRQFCGVVRYANKGATAHRGLLVGKSDVDFGPASGNPFWGAGECPWSYGGPGINSNGESVKTTKTPLMKKKNGKLAKGRKKGELCCCVSCGDVKDCISKVCSEWNDKSYGFYSANNCMGFVSDAKSKCCLEDL